MRNPTVHVDWAVTVPQLAAHARDDRDFHQLLARDLVRPTDRLAVDVGCGGAGMTLTLAAAMTGGRVVAVDGHASVVAEARRHVQEQWSDPRVRIDVVEADLPHGDELLRAALPGPADVVWASASVHHLPDQQAAITMLAGLLAPGGRLALAEGGLASRHLPWDLGFGEPGHELRLQSAEDRWFAAMRISLPGSRGMPYSWTEALRRAGLTEVTSRTVLIERPVPLSDHDRRRVIDGLGIRVRRAADAGMLGADDVAVWDRLLDPSDARYLGRRDDLSHLEGRSVHLGGRAADS